MALPNQPIDASLAQLLQAASAADSSTPTNISVAASGEATAEFEGSISAKGINFQELVGQFVANTIKWTDPVNAHVDEQIIGFKSGSQHFLHLDAGPTPHALNTTTPSLEINGSDFENQGKVSVFGGGSAGGAVGMLLNAFGESDYLRRAGGKGSLFGVWNIGISTVFFPGSHISEIGTVSHGLGVTPSFIMMQVSGVSFEGNFPVFNAGATNVVNFQMNAETRGISGPGSLTFYWLAIG